MPLSPREFAIRSGRARAHGRAPSPGSHAAPWCVCGCVGRPRGPPAAAPPSRTRPAPPRQPLPLPLPAGGGGPRLGPKIFVLGSVPRDWWVTAQISSSGDSSSGPRPRVAPGNDCLCIPLRGPCHPKNPAVPLPLPTGAAGGVAKRAGWPSSAGLFLRFVVIIDLGHKPGHSRVPNEQLFWERTWVKRVHTAFVCFGLAPTNAALCCTGPANPRFQS